MWPEVGRAILSGVEILCEFLHGLRKGWFIVDLGVCVCVECLAWLPSLTDVGCE